MISPSPANPSPSRSPTKSTARAVRSSSRRKPPSKWPTSSKLRSSGWTKSRWCRAAPTFLKIGTQTVSATVHQPKYEINVNTQEHLAAKTLDLNAIGVANITTDREIPFAPYTENRDLGGFILIDKITNRTIAAGMIHFALRRAQNIHWQATDITRESHAAMKNQKPAVLWLTGLSGSGKSTIANDRREETGADEPPHLPPRRR